MGEYHHKVDIKRLLLTYNHLGKAGRQASKQSTESPLVTAGTGVSLSEGSDAGLASDRDGDMISDRKL